MPLNAFCQSIIAIADMGSHFCSGRNVELDFCCASGRDKANEPVDFGFCFLVDFRFRLGPFGDDQIIFSVAHAVPELFRDERHERVEHDDDLVEHPAGDDAGFVCRAGILALQNGLDQFEIPVAEAVPCEVIDSVRGGIEAQVGQCLVERALGLDDLADDPAVDRQTGFWRSERIARADTVYFAEAGSIPQLGGEIAIAFDPLVIHLDVTALAFHRRHEETQCIGTILVDQAERIDNIALRLGHFGAIFRAHQPVQIEPLPRDFLHELDPLHRHPRVPEEQDIKAGDQQVIRIMAFQILGLLRPAQCAERP